MIKKPRTLAGPGAPTPNEVQSQIESEPAPVAAPPLQPPTEPAVRRNRFGMAMGNYVEKDATTGQRYAYVVQPPNSPLGSYTDVRWVAADYVLAMNERDGYAEVLPDPEQIAGYVPPPPPVPEQISDRQYFEALANQGVITQDEALAAVKTGDMPPAITNYINGLPTGDEQFNARMYFEGATVFDRHNQYVIAMAQANGLTDKQLDELWTYGASL